MCQTCLGVFSSGQRFIAIFDKFYFHQECFKCMNCFSNLEMNKFYLTSDLLYLCIPCSEQRKSVRGNNSSEKKDETEKKQLLRQDEICSICQKPVVGDFLKIFGEVHHPECFRCSQCTQVCSGEFFYKDKQTLCLDCYLEKAHICKACEKPILKKMYLRYGKYWHLECLESNISDSYRDDDQKESEDLKIILENNQVYILI